MTNTRQNLVSKGTLAMVVALGVGCRGQGVAENTGGGATVEVTTQALTTVDIDRVLGFEATTVSDWSIIQSGPGTLSVSTTASQGSRSLAVASHGYVPVQSVALTSLGSRLGSVIHYDIMLPSQLKQVSPAYYGATQLYLNSTSLGLNNTYLGQVELTPLPLGQWNTVTFTPTSSVLTKLRGTYSDLRVTIVVNAPYNATQPYLLDNLRFSDSTLALVTVVDGGGHPLSGLTVTAYNGSTVTSNTGVTDSTGLAKVWVPPGSYRFGVTEAGVTTYSSATNQCQVPGICVAATIIAKCHGVVCMAKDQCHSVGVCDPSAGVCSNPNKANGTACNDGNACTKSDVCKAGVCGGTAYTCNDGLACTADSCNGDGTCTFSVTAGNCLIGGACYAGGAGSPTNQCQQCTPATSQTAWSPKASGTSCNDGNACTANDVCNGAGQCGGTAYACNDGLICTVDTCNGDGTCSFALSPGNCLIGGVCYAAGAISPVNQCQQCTPTTSQTGWTPRTDGTGCNDGNACTGNDKCTAGTCGGTAYSCDDGLACTTDACNGDGTCTHTTTAGNCLIGGACYPAGAASPTNQCQQCTPTTSQTAWSAKTNGTSCNDGNACTSNDICTAGTCGGTGYSCDDGLACTTDACNGDGTCTHTITAGSCVANGACYVGGASNPTNACQICNPAQATTWSNQVDGTTCNDSNACTPADAGIPDSDGGDAGAETNICGDGSCDAGNPAACVNHTCIAGACTGICVPGKAQCNGQTAQTCDATGNWQDGATCVDQACVAGACQGVCAPGARRCSEQTPQICDATGNWQDPQPCDAGQICLDGATVCSYPNAASVCTNGVCSMGACNPGFSDCNGDPADGCEVASTTCHCNSASDCPVGFACDTTSGACTRECCIGCPPCNGGCCQLEHNSPVGNCVAGNTATQCGSTGAACNNCYGPSQEGFEGGTGAQGGTACIAGRCGCNQVGDCVGMHSHFGAVSFLSCNVLTNQCDGMCGDANHTDCADGSYCLDGACKLTVSCGGLGEPCWTNWCTNCNANLTCDGGTCQCGAEGQSCCGGTSCGSNLTCGGMTHYRDASGSFVDAVASGLCACGFYGEPCCQGTSCYYGGSCVAGVCGCVASYECPIGQACDPTTHSCGTNCANSECNGSHVCCDRSRNTCVTVGSQCGAGGYVCLRSDPYLTCDTCPLEPGCWACGGYGQPCCVGSTCGANTICTYGFCESPSN